MAFSSAEGGASWPHDLEPCFVGNRGVKRQSIVNGTLPIALPVTGPLVEEGEIVKSVRCDHGDANCRKETLGFRTNPENSSAEKKCEGSRAKPCMRPNAVLVVGDPQYEVLQWITLGLVEKGYAVRLACQDFSKAVCKMGVPGLNVDMVELEEFSTDAQFSEALECVQALVLCCNMEPQPGPSYPARTKARQAAGVTTRLLDIASHKEGMQKIVMVSRFIPGARGEAEEENPLLVLAGTAAAFGGLETTKVENSQSSLQEPVFDEFRRLHEQQEVQVRACGMNYVIVRAPTLILNTRPGAVDPLAVLATHTAAALQNRKNWWCKVNHADKSRCGALEVGALDLAEAVVHSLSLCEMSGISFTLCARSCCDKSAMVSRAGAEGGDTEAVSVEVQHLPRVPDTFCTQREEDIAREAYWRCLLAGLPKDA
ncbi:hypothetical protein B484DRAFT_451600 [Ochromonadaceae sp. CCMP2298]|nr:hypothetical protein B484DRAFT_451600 [Ochromonadaceae sp. CCMP2298]|mmetsp:Transcript_22774/g.50651  ORF Transcript_22774/g.50651 Transcript_22774/m.50651 type:complete len:427 (-) Transcript_22774:294-1574(-)